MPLETDIIQILLKDSGHNAEELGLKIVKEFVLTFY